MQVKVHMLAFEEGKIRMVTIPASDEEAINGLPPDRRFAGLLNLVFHYGQNEIAIGPEKNKTCSVSAGDVIELPNGELYYIKRVGFYKLGCTCK